MVELSQRTQLFGTLGSPLLLRLGCDWTLEDRRASPREYPQISMFSSSGFPQLRRERDPSPTIRHPGKKQLVRLEQFVQQCTWDAFPRTGATWPCIYSPTALVLGEWRTIPWRRWHCVHELLQLHHRERLLSVGFSGTAHSVTALGRFKTMDAVSEPQTLAPNTLYHCACITVLVSLCLSQCACLNAACLSAVSQCVASFYLAFQPWLTRV